MVDSAQSLLISTLRLAQMAQFKAGFLARTAHELRSPLSSLMSLHQLILNDLCESPEEERECLQMAYESAQRLLEMLELVINLSKSEFGSRPLQIQPLSLYQVLEEFYAFARLQMTNRSLGFQVDLPNPDVTVLADANCLHQTLLCVVDSTLRDRSASRLWVGSVVDLAKQEVKIQIRDDRPIEALAESIDLLTQPPLALETVAQHTCPDPDHPTFHHFSSHLMLSMAQIYLELMAGRLELLEWPGETSVVREALEPSAPSATESSRGFLLQCCLPLAV